MWSMEKYEKERYLRGFASAKESIDKYPEVPAKIWIGQQKDYLHQSEFLTGRIDGFLSSIGV